MVQEETIIYLPFCYVNITELKFLLFTGSIPRQHNNHAAKSCCFREGLCLAASALLNFIIIFE